MKPLGFRSINILKENGYQIRERNEFVSFRKIDRNQYVDVGIGILFIVSSVFLIQDYPIMWTSLSLILLSSYFIWKRYRLRSLLIFDHRQKAFGVQNHALRASWYHFEDVDRVSINSKYIEEFESSLKSELAHHLITLSFTLRDNTKLELLKFKSEFRDPPVQIMDIYNWLVDTVGLQRV